MMIFHPGIKISEKQADKGFEATGMLAWFYDCVIWKCFRRIKNNRQIPSAKAGEMILKGSIAGLTGNKFVRKSGSRKAAFLFNYQ
jgi:hypothetical protein